MKPSVPVLTLPTFIVNKPEDWDRVTAFLVRKAGVTPQAQNQTMVYSPTEKEADRRNKAIFEDPVKRQHAVSFSAVVIYKRFWCLSLVMTYEPRGLHLSMTSIIEPGKQDNPPGKNMERVPDKIAIEAAALLGKYEETVEGVMPKIRHFIGQAVRNN